MTKQPTGLATFRLKGQAQAEQAERDDAATGRKRGKGETVALTVRLPRAEWARLRQLADSEGVGLQALAVRGLDKVFADHGLPPIRIDVKAS